jgi:hypothetical protein
MRKWIAPGVLGLSLLAPAMALGQVDSAMIARARLTTRVRQVDTTAVRFRRPVSRMVLETAWAAADTGRRSASMVVRRPAWSSQAVLYQRLLRQLPTDPLPRIAVAARRLVPAAAVRPLTPTEDSALGRQLAADFRVRAEAVARIQAIPALRLHPTIATNLINELDSLSATRLATPPVAGPDSVDEQEAYPEYVISLSRAVARLKDPRSVRALALGGLVTSREIQRFVAAQGPQALGPLDTAFAASDATAPAVVTTWGYTLAAKPSKLRFEDSVYVYARIVLSAQYYPVSFAHAARQAKLFELMPELDSIVARAADSQPVVAAVARLASRRLASVRDSASAADWLARLRLRTGVVCMDESRLGPEVCRALLGATANATGSLGNTDAMRLVMTQYHGLLDAAVAARLMSPEASGSLGQLVNGLLRASGDRRRGPPGVRLDLHHLPIRRVPI